MITTKTIAAGLVALTTLSAVPANAAGFSFQFGPGPGASYYGGYGYGHGHQWRHGRVSTDEVRFMLRRHGYRAIRFVDDRGAIYQLRARKHGRSYFIVVSARNGEILSQRRI
jgi:hypothetical protein